MKTKKTKIRVSKTFKDLSLSKSRYVLLRGSTRSGKTVAVIQYLLQLMINNKNLKIIVGVQTIEQAKDSLIYDLDEWILRLGLLNDFNIIKSPHRYTRKFSKSVLIIKPCDDPRKWHGAEADIFWFNEATHINYEVFFQSTLRLPDRKDFLNRIILDFNPTSPYSWVRELERQDGVETFISTYKDNPFLGEEQVKAIEILETQDYNKWLVYGKGEYGEVAGAIYRNFELIDEKDIPQDIEHIYYGLDFGYSNDPAALIKVKKNGNNLYIEEMIYEIGLTNDELSEKMNILNINKNDTIVADSAEPKSIQEIYNYGFNIKAAKKGPDSVNIGIDILKRYKIFVNKKSDNLIDEFTNYTFEKDRITGKYKNKPIDKFNHLLDALRYVALLYFGNDVPRRRFQIRKVR